MRNHFSVSQQIFYSNKETKNIFKLIITKILYDRNQFCQSCEKSTFTSNKAKKSCLDDIVYDKIDDELKAFCTKNQKFNKYDYALLLEKYFIIFWCANYC